ncbi:MAG TPA: 7-cyano-7-deazaguanine synthase QueC [Patescibacteria group bacterium]|nr:7-cyano-7-deazaguanine synthase QueC [Patescibacteria group bacterium]
MKNKAVMGLSGGMDSATLLGLLVGQGYEVHCCVFYYGSKHNKYENRAAENLIDWYQNKDFPVLGYPIDISKVMEDFSSNLLLSGGEIPEGHYEAENMRKTVVPGRNLIFASIMSGLAESLGAQVVALGIHQGDHHIYPDCRTEFAKALDTTVYLSSDRQVEVTAPLITDNKKSILEKGFSLTPAVPYHLTRTCYKDQPISCGKCGSCQERLEAFRELEMKDPIEYEKFTKTSR